MSDRIPLISTQTADLITGYRLRGAATTQLVQDPPAIAITRKLTASGPTIVATFTPVSIALANQGAGTAGANGPTGAVTRRGTVTAFALDVSAPVNVGDGFVWQGQPCQVTTEPMEDVAMIVTFDFVTTAKNRI